MDATYVPYGTSRASESRAGCRRRLCCWRLGCQALRFQPRLPLGNGWLPRDFVIIVSVTEGFAGELTGPLHGIKPHGRVVVVQIFDKLLTGRKVVVVDGRLDGGDFQCRILASQ